MTVYEPHPDSPAPKDGDRVRVGDFEGVWRPLHNLSIYAGGIYTDEARLAYVIKGVPVTVLRPVECDHDWHRCPLGGYDCCQCDLHVDRLVPEREPVDLNEAVRVYRAAPSDARWEDRTCIRAVLEWAGVPVKDEP